MENKYHRCLVLSRIWESVGRLRGLDNVEYCIWFSSKENDDKGFGLEFTRWFECLFLESLKLTQTQSNTRSTLYLGFLSFSSWRYQFYLLLYIVQKSSDLLRNLLENLMKTKRYYFKSFLYALFGSFELFLFTKTFVS